jgi:hypothetical protein
MLCGFVFLTSVLLALATAVAGGSANQNPLTSSRVKLSLPTVEEFRGANGDYVMGTLKLPNGSKFQTTFFDLKVIGQLQTTHKLPYYVLSGVGCQECDANISIYIHSPSDGPMKDEGTQQRFDYPGRVLSREDRGALSITRMFLGDCAPEYPNAVIWFEHSIGDDGRWHDTVFVARIEQDKLIETVPKVNVPTIGEAEDAARKSQCRELPGLDQWEEP